MCETEKPIRAAVQKSSFKCICNIEVGVNRPKKKQRRCFYANEARRDISSRGWCKWKVVKIKRCEVGGTKWGDEQLTANKNYEQNNNFVLLRKLEHIKQVGTQDQPTGIEPQSCWKRWRCSARDVCSENSDSRGLVNLLNLCILGDIFCLLARFRKRIINAKKWG